MRITEKQFLKAMKILAAHLGRDKARKHAEIEAFKKRLHAKKG